MKMKKLRAAVVGYGNVGRFALEALEAAPDFEVAGIVRRNGAANLPLELTNYQVVKDIKELTDVDVAILACPTRSCPDYAKQILPLGINTVDSFDIHTSILDYRHELMPINKETNTVSVIAAGWDPGSDSIVRTLMQSLAPKGLSYTNFGPGMSMGHSVCLALLETVTALGGGAVVETDVQVHDGGAGVHGGLGLTHNLFHSIGHCGILFFRHFGTTNGGGND